VQLAEQVDDVGAELARRFREQWPDMSPRIRTALGLAIVAVFRSRGTMGHGEADLIALLDGRGRGDASSCHAYESILGEAIAAIEKRLKGEAGRLAAGARRKTARDADIAARVELCAFLDAVNGGEELRPMETIFHDVSRNLEREGVRGSQGRLLSSGGVKTAYYKWRKAERENRSTP